MPASRDARSTSRWISSSWNACALVPFMQGGKRGACPQRHSENSRARAQPSAATIAASFCTGCNDAPKIQQPNVSRMQSFALLTTSPRQLLKTQRRAELRKAPGWRPCRRLRSAPVWPRSHRTPIRIRYLAGRKFAKVDRNSSYWVSRKCLASAPVKKSASQ